MLVFQDIADVSTWLSRQPHKTTVACSVRAALRVLPAFASATAYWISEPAREGGIIKIAFEFASMAWSSAISEEADHQRLDLLRAYAPRLTMFVEQEQLSITLQSENGVVAVEAAKAFGFTASAASSSGADAVSFATNAIKAAVSAASQSSPASRSSAVDRATMLQACAADAALIDGGASPEDVLSQPLWITPQPEWAASSWTELKSYIHSRHQNLGGGSAGTSNV